MKRQHDCHCNEDRTTEEDIAALGRQMRYLMRIVAEFMDMDPQDSGQRSDARRAASELERIMGGRPVTPGTFPECCLIGHVSGGGFLTEWYCTGTLIHPRAVITADHCISRTVGRLDPNSIAIGVDDQGSVQSADILRVARIHRHPTEDLALLVLQTPATIDPVARASTAETGNADQVRLVGFGNTDATGTIGFGRKREVTVQMNVVRKTETEDLTEAEAILGFDSRTEFVAGRKGSGKDSCKGDSGGPAYLFVDNERKLCGATSRATDEANDVCGDGGVYVRIDATGAWIDEVLAHL